MDVTPIAPEFSGIIPEKSDIYPILKYKGGEIAVAID
jgi:hypothetical protein